MPAPAELPVKHVNFPCRDEREFQQRFAPHITRDGLFVPCDPPLPEGARLLLRLHWIGGAIGVRGEAVVTLASSPGRMPGMTVKLVRLSSDSVQFPLTLEPATDPGYNRFGPWPDDPVPPPPPSTPAPPAKIWQLPTTPHDATPFENFDEPERGPGLQTVVDFAPEERTRQHAPHAELLRAAGGGKVKLAVTPSVRFGNYVLLAPSDEKGAPDTWIAATSATSGLSVVKAVGAGVVSVALAHQAKVIAGLTHPNLRKVVDFGAVEGRAFIAFEHLHGRRLDAIIARLRAVPLVPQVEFALALGLDVCRTLEYLHSLSEPLPHGEVHGRNVFIGADGEVRLELPGIGVLDTLDEPTVEGDLHALGGLLHDLLTLREPPPGSPASRLAHEPRAHWHRVPSDWNRAIPDSIDSLVLGATHADPSHRYPSARELRASLEEEQRRHSAPSLAAMMSELFGPELDRERAELAALVSSSCQ